MLEGYMSVMDQPWGKEPLEWSQPRRLGRLFELSDQSGEVLGKLELVKIWGRKAVGEYGGQRFHFDSTGLVRPTVRVTNELGEITATARLRWKMHLKAEIDLSNGRRYHLLTFGVVGRNWKLRDEEGRELCSLVEKWGVMRQSGTFGLLDIRGTDPEPGFLALLVWYIVLMITYQEGAVAAGGSS
jgi:hypothetical protein